VELENYLTRTFLFCTFLSFTNQLEEYEMGGTYRKGFNAESLGILALMNAGIKR
jgi:hypothetical protein